MNRKLLYNKCPVCGSVFRSGPDIIYKDMPVMQSEVWRQRDNALGCVLGDISLGFCPECGAISNMTFEPEKVIYNQDYDNRQDLSESFQAHLQEVLRFIFRDRAGSRPQPDRILEIGCGKGTFLRQLSESVSGGAYCCGYDPSYTGTENNGDLHFVKEYYNGEHNGTYDLVVLRHVIEHIQNPVEMFKLAYEAMSGNGLLYIETPAFGWILNNRAFFDITYEHCSYFCIETIERLLMRAGLSILDWKYTFSGQYLSIVAEKNGKISESTHFASADIVEAMQNFEKEKEQGISKVQQSLREINRSGRVAFWGAAGKGVMCCSLFDPEASLIDSVVDINPNKTGAFIPKTAHRVIAPEEIVERKIKFIFVLNGNYIREVTGMARSISSDIQVRNFEQELKEMLL